MKQMIYRQIVTQVNNMVIRKREYLKQKPDGGFTWDKRFKYHTFPSHKAAVEILKYINPKSGMTVGIEPKDNLHYSVIY